MLNKMFKVQNLWQPYISSANVLLSMAAKNCIFAGLGWTFLAEKNIV